MALIAGKRHCPMLLSTRVIHIGHVATNAGPRGPRSWAHDSSRSLENYRARRHPWLHPALLGLLAGKQPRRHDHARQTARSHPARRPPRTQRSLRRAPRRRVAAAAVEAVTPRKEDAAAQVPNAAPDPAGGTHSPALPDMSCPTCRRTTPPTVRCWLSSLTLTLTRTRTATAHTAWAGLLKELELALEAAGMPLRDAWIIGAEFWRNAYCSDPGCCGPTGRPVEQIRNSRLNAEMVFRGSSVGAAPGAQGTTPVSRSADPAVHAAESGWAEQFSPRRRDRAQFAQVLDIWTMVLQTAIGREHPSGLAPDTDAPRHTAPNHKAPNHNAPGKRSSDTHDARDLDPQSAGQPLELTPELTGYLRASLCIPSWRDALLVMAAAGRTAAERGAEDFGIFDPQAGSGSPPVSRPGPTPSPLPGPTSGSTSGSMSGSRSGSTSGSTSAPLPPLLDMPADGRPVAAAAPGPDASAAPGHAPSPDPSTDAVPGYGEVLLGLAPSVPDWALMVGLERVLELLGGLGDGEPTAAAVTARGWIEWCRGRGSYADALYRQALEDHPGYRLAELLAELGRRGTLCGWAARREAAWQKFAPDAA